MVKHIPNSITLLNLFFGCCGILACFNHQYALVPIFIGISLLADFLDGFIALAASTIRLPATILSRHGNIWCFARYDAIFCFKYRYKFNEQ